MADRVRCPVCEERFDLDTDLEAEDITYCPACSAELKVLKLHPAEVEEVDNSWDDYQDHDEEGFENGAGYDKKSKGGDWS